MSTGSIIDFLTSIDRHMHSISDFSLHIEKHTSLCSDDASQAGCLTRPHIKTVLSIRETGSTMTELSSMVRVKRPWMSVIVDSLIEKRLVERTADPDDRRIVRVRLTEKGAQVQKKIISRRIRELAGIFHTLAKEDQQELASALQTVSGIIQKAASRSGERCTGREDFANNTAGLATEA